MSDTQRIVLDIDDGPAKAGAARANTALSSIEKNAERAAAAMGKSIEGQMGKMISFSDAGARQIERAVTAAEKQAKALGLSGTDKILAQRAELLRKVAGDSGATDRAVKAYDQILAKEKELDAFGPKLAAAIRNPLQAAGSAAESLVASFGTVGVVATAVAVGTALTAKGMYDLANAQGAAAESNNNLADRLGVTNVEAYRLKIQADIAGSSVEALEGAFKNLAKAIEDGSAEGKAGQRVMAELGVRALDPLTGKVRGAVDLFRDLGVGMAAIESPTERSRKAIELFGKSGEAFVPLLRQFKETEATAKEASEGITNELLGTLGRFNDKVDETWAKWDGLQKKLAGKVVATVEFVTKVTGSLPAKALEAFLDPGSLIRAGEQRRRDEANASADASSPLPILLKGTTAAGDKLAAQARARIDATDQGLKARLAEATAARVKAANDITPGLSYSLQKERIAAYEKAIGLENSLTAAVKARATAEQDAVKAQAKFQELAREELKLMGHAQGALLLVGNPRNASNQLQLEKGPQEAYELSRKYSEKMFGEAVARDTDLKELQIENTRTRFEQDAIIASAAHDAQLRQLDAFNAVTVNDKIAVEQRKAAIEVDYLQKSLGVRQQILEADKAVELARAGSNAELRLEIEKKYELERRGLVLASDAEVAAARQGAIIKSTQIQISEQQRAFDSIKQSANGLLDQLFARSQSLSDIALSFFKSIILTPLKELASTEIAALFTGGRAQSAGSGGILGRILGMGGLAGAGAFGSTGAPGGTPGFSGPVGGAGGGGGLSSLLGFGGSVAGVKSLLGISNSIQLGPGMATTWQAATMGQKLGAMGHSTGAALAGGALAYDGLRRGGLLGLGETAAGGALIGFKFGGPIGAAIGGGIGAAAGLVRLFSKGAEEKIVSKVKQIYGLDIDRSFAKDPLLGIIKQNFGGNLDVGLQSPMVRDLIELYAMSFGKSPSGGFTKQMTPLSFSQSGGALTQMPSYQNGTRLPSIMPSGGTPVIQHVTLSLNVDGKALGPLLDGRQLENLKTDQGVRAVSKAFTRGQEKNIDRRQQLVNAMVPGLLVR